MHALRNAPSARPIIEALVGLAPFATASWESIDNASQLGIAKYLYNVGDTKNITLSTNEVITVRLEAFEYDDLTNGGKAGITIATRDLLATTQSMNATAGNSGWWRDSRMRVTQMPIYLSQLPSDLRAVIKQVNKPTNPPGQTAVITSDSLWLFSLEETLTINTRYPLFLTSASSRIKKLANGSGAAQSWWTRTPDTGAAFNVFSTDGELNALPSTSAQGVCFGFCV